MSRLSWNEYGLRLAEVASERSEDPYVRVGCALLRHDHSVLSLGYNGGPPGVELNWNDRDERRLRVSHAENSALRWAKPGEIGLVCLTMSPCCACMVQMASYGVREIIFRSLYKDSEKSLELAKEFGIEMTEIPKDGEPKKLVGKPGYLFMHEGPIKLPKNVGY